MPDEDAISTPYLFRLWASGTAYTAGDRVRYGDLLYRCLLGHTSQDDWPPDAAVALWVWIHDPSVEWPSGGSQRAHMTLIRLARGYHTQVSGGYRMQITMYGSQAFQDGANIQEVKINER